MSDTPCVAYRDAYITSGPITVVVQRCEQTIASAYVIAITLTSQKRTATNFSNSQSARILFSTKQPSKFNVKIILIKIIIKIIIITHINDEMRD